jgi:phosphatidyl-myo-inositol alpha-mannosyltransferase
VRPSSQLQLAVTSYYLPSTSKIGAGWMAHRLANALVEIGHQVTMFSPSPRPEGSKYAHHLVEVNGKFRAFRWGIKVREIDFSRFDGLLAQGDDHFVKRGAAKAHVRTMHGSCFDEARHIKGLRPKTRMFALGCTELISAVRTPEVVGVSKSSLRYFPWRKTVIPNGVDTSIFHPVSPPVKEIDPTILFVGTYNRRKRGRMLQEVFEEYIRPRVPNARLWMVCDDAPEAPGVEVLGRLSDEDLADRYRRAWVFCLPSTYEGFGVPYIEAFLSGTTVVATGNPGAKEVLDGGRIGVLSTDQELGPQIVRQLVDGKQRSHFEQLGIEQRDVYDFLSIARRYAQLVRDQLGCPDV